MPISTDSTKHSIDFSYEWETPSGETLVYPMKYLHTPQFGPTVQIFFDGQSIELPADMFVEVSSFLAQQGVIRGSIANIPKMQNKPSPLATPMVKNKLVNPGMMPQRNPLIPQDAISSLQNIQDQPPATEVDPEEILKTRMEAKAKASAARRGKIEKRHKGEEQEE